jgi:hypothetical protein
MFHRLLALLHIFDQRLWPRMIFTLMISSLWYNVTPCDAAKSTATFFGQVMMCIARSPSVSKICEKEMSLGTQTSWSLFGYWTLSPRPSICLLIAPTAHSSCCSPSLGPIPALTPRHDIKSCALRDPRFVWCIRLVEHTPRSRSPSITAPHSSHSGRP